MVEGSNRYKFGLFLPILSILIQVMYGHIIPILIQCNGIGSVLVQKMPQRRDNAGAVCDSGMGMLFLNQQLLSYRRLLYQKMW